MVYIPIQACARKKGRLYGLVKNMQLSVLLLSLTWCYILICTLLKKLPKAVFSQKPVAQIKSS